MKRILLPFILILGLAGCAVNARYVAYTDQRFPAKSGYYFVNIYPENQVPKFTEPYRVIGRVEVSGHASEGVNPDMLADKARNVARAKGADAILNVRAEAANYGGMNVIPGHCGYRRCRPPEYYPYNDTLFTFRGELIAFTPAPVRQN